MRSYLLSTLAAVLLVTAACAGEPGEQTIEGDTGDPGDLIGVAEPEGFVAAGTLAVGDLARVTASALNQRSGPSASYEILRAMPNGTTVTILEAQNGWYKNDWGGRIGWSSGAYLEKVSSGDTGTFDVSGLSIANFISIAKASVGYTYWWGHGKLGGSKSGACYGGCPDCSHSGTTGADCSGFIAKAWMLPEAMPITGSDDHPFSTYHFYNQTNHWSGVSRSNTKKGDAMVYRSGSGGHIFLYESLDPWGSMWTYEARGCSYGIVHNLRTAGSTYKTIRRDI